MYGAETSPWFVAVLALLWGYVKVKEWREGPEPTRLEEAQAAYERGDMTLTEFERIAEVELDPRAQELRDALERIDGVGPETSAAAAREFDGLEEIRAADRDALEKVHGVGPSTSREIHRRFE